MPEVSIVGEAANGVDALRLIQELHPDLILLDIEMPQMNGMEVARNLHDNGSQTQILVISSYNDHELVLGMLDLGAAGYLSKEEAPEKLVDAIWSIVSNC